MACDSHLSRQDYVVTDFSRPREPHLRAQQRVFANGRSVAYLNQIVDFGAARNRGLADSGAIDTARRLDLDVVSDDDDAGLDDLVPMGLSTFISVILGEAEAVGAYDYGVLQYYVIA